MSRIGIKPILVENGTTVEVTPIEIIVSGQGGQIHVALPHGINVSQKDNKIFVERAAETKQYKSLHGTIRSLLNNAVTGVSKGFEKKLELIGIGYRAAMEGGELVLQVGFTHPVKVAIPTTLQVKVEKNIITIAGKDKQEVGQFAAVVRSMRKPEPYKGKGIRYQGEIVRMKQGKATKAGA
jgi:large subunit ribosomal protein L6